MTASFWSSTREVGEPQLRWAGEGLRREVWGKAYHRLMKFLQVIVGMALPLLAFLLFVFDDGWSALVVRLLIVGAGIAQAFITYRTVKSAAQARAAKKVEMNDQLSPLAYTLARIPAASGLVQRRTAIVSFLTKTVATCVSLTDEERSRATFYEVIEEAGSRVFVPAGSSGRGDPAKSRFKEGDGADGAVVWAKAVAGEPTFVEDWRKDPPEHFDVSRTDRKYLTFITVPVVTYDGPVGLLTVNGPNPGDLTSSDVETMQMLADLCAAAIGMGDGKCPPMGGH